MPLLRRLPVLHRLVQKYRVSPACGPVSLCRSRKKCPMGLLWTQNIHPGPLVPANPKQRDVTTRRQLTDVLYSDRLPARRRRQAKPVSAQVLV